MKFPSLCFIVFLLYCFPSNGQNKTSKLYAEIRNGFSKTLVFKPLSVRERTSHVFATILFYEVNFNPKRTMLFGMGIETSTVHSKTICSFCGPDFSDNSRIDIRNRYTYLSLYVNRKYLLTENLYLKIGGSIDHPFLQNEVKKLNNKEDGKKYKLSESAFDLKGFYNTTLGLNSSLEKKITFRNGAKLTLGIYCKVHNSFGVWYAYGTYNHYKIPSTVRPVSFGLLVGLSSKN